MPFFINTKPEMAFHAFCIREFNWVRKFSIFIKSPIGESIMVFSFFFSHIWKAHFSQNPIYNILIHVRYFTCSASFPLLTEIQVKIKCFFSFIEWN